MNGAPSQSGARKHIAPSEITYKIIPGGRKGSIITSQVAHSGGQCGMAVIGKGFLVLVTGANGYVASWICMRLLQEGYAVRGTTRDVAKGEWLRHMFLDHGLTHFEYTVVSDLRNRDAFHEAVIGVDVIIHCASPYHWRITSSQDLIVPATAGTESVLRAATKETTVRRVVITSSYGSIMENRESGFVTFTEEDWNEQSLEVIAKEGEAAWHMHWYRASKTMAEKRAWEYVKENRAQFDLVTICPPIVLGPPVNESATATGLGTSMSTWYSFLTGTKTSEEAVAPAGVMCDVRDVAYCHVKALSLPEAAGRRLGLATRSFTYQVLLDHIRECLGDQVLQVFPNMTRGSPGAPIPPMNQFDCSKSLQLLQLTPISDRKTAVDMTVALMTREKHWRSQNDLFSQRTGLMKGGPTTEDSRKLSVVG